MEETATVTLPHVFTACSTSNCNMMAFELLSWIGYRAKQASHFRHMNTCTSFIAAHPLPDPGYFHLKDEKSETYCSSLYPPRGSREQVLYSQRCSRSQTSIPCEILCTVIFSILKWIVEFHHVACPTYYPVYETT